MVLRTKKSPDSEHAGLGNRLALAAFVIACAAILYIVGFATARYRLPPYGVVDGAIKELKTALQYRKDRLPWQYFRILDAPSKPVIVHDQSVVAGGATLISGFTVEEETHSIKIVSSEGKTIQQWELEWDTLWPGNALHVPKRVLGRPQKHIHGVALANNGDIVVNFTEIATLRVNTCGDVVWRLDRRGHHSVDLAPDGSFWIPGVITHYEPSDRFPNHAPPFEEFTALHVAADGTLLDEFSVNELLIENGHKGLLYLSTLNEFTPIVSTDTLHLNDIEVFDGRLGDGVASDGDLLMSLRNINTVILVDPEERKIKFISSGRVTRQHDVDFVDANTFTVFDNNNLLPEWLDNSSGTRGDQGQKSLVAEVSLETGEVTDVIDSAGGKPFFTDLMGAHQWLDGGNLLVVESRAGRVFERAPDGSIVWEYFNIIDEELLGAVSSAERLDSSFDAEFFSRARSECGL